MFTHAKRLLPALAALVIAALSATYLATGAENAAAGERARVENAVEKKVKKSFRKWARLDVHVLSCRPRAGGRFKCHWFAEHPSLWWGEGNAKVKPRTRGYRVKLRRVMKECVAGGHECYVR